VAPPLVTCYAQPGKAKSLAVLAAFAAGAGGAPVLCGPSKLMSGAAAFFGVVGIEHLFLSAQEQAPNFYYGDNAYFDGLRGHYFRFTRNAFQVSMMTTPRADALARLRMMKGSLLTLNQWRKGGEHVVVVEQSPHFLQLSNAPGGARWLELTLGELAQHTDRKIIVRRWSRDKARAADSLHADLRGAHALVTHMSAAANEALLAGIPVFVTGDCAAKPLASGALTGIEYPSYADGRLEWAANLSSNQWTLEELRHGLAWKHFNC
jgi:hypothetical protein